MATQKQIDLIGELLEELDWTRRDLAREFGQEFGEYEALDVDLASELIDNLIQEKRLSGRSGGWN